MELWQVIAYFTPDGTEPARDTPGGLGAHRPGLSSTDVIRARLAAHEAGRPEPLHIFGDVDVED